MNKEYYMHKTMGCDYSSMPYVQRQFAATDFEIGVCLDNDIHPMESNGMESSYPNHIDKKKDNNDKSVQILNFNL